ncbi:sensor [Nitrospira sp. KM1]|uniref:FecR family protein n=1 Tax=Nitrospira sp. KM1 TaxID=1936990 RepID=UPI0013A77064|nr:FecR domain-containing protein [Nitrospira sp. KM1]BCA56595.1 sensor [Nitrospira sp. KM1]
MQSAFFDMIDPRPSQHTLVEQAVAWLVRLQSDHVTDADRARFTAWYETSDAHRVAYTEAKDLMGRLHQPAQELWDEQVLTPVPGAGQMVRGLIGRWIPATAVCAVLALAVFVLWNAFTIEAPGTIKTVKGEHRTVNLEDGSTVLLNAETTVRVAFTDQHRSIELIAGEASFVVAKDPQRPFEVTAAHGMSTALGTEFNVRLHRSATTVTVVEGVVQVSQQRDQAHVSAPVRVHPRETVSYSKTGGISAVVPSDEVMSLAWQRGQLVFNKKPLAEVVEELDRQWTGHIFVAGTQLRQLPVNGVFDIHDASSAVRAIERILHVRSVTLPLNVIVIY